MNVLKPHLQTTIWTLLALGTSQREIERVTGIDRKTIRAYQKRFAAAPANSPGVATGSSGANSPTPATGSARPTVSACEPHRGFIEAQLRLRRNAMAIYQDLVDCNSASPPPTTRSSASCASCASASPSSSTAWSSCPARRCRSTTAKGAPTRVPGTDRYRKPRLFVATLRYSRRSFRRVVWKSSQETWARLHEQAWRYFGGSCRYVVLDNLKEGVIKPDLYEPELNPVYAATLAHYGVVADPARVRDPNRKGTVENAIGHTQATALKGRRFESLEEQNDFLEHWESKWAASRIHGSARRQVQAMFEEERPASGAAAGHAVLPGTAAHRLRRHLRARRQQQLRRAAGAHRLEVLVRAVRAPHRDPRPQDAGAAAHPRPRRAPRLDGAAR